MKCFLFVALIAMLVVTLTMAARRGGRRGDRVHGVRGGRGRIWGRGGGGHFSTHRRPVDRHPPQPCLFTSEDGEETSLECPGNAPCTVGPRNFTDVNGTEGIAFSCLRKPRGKPCLFVKSTTTDVINDVIDDDDVADCASGSCTVGPFSQPEGDIEIYFCEQDGSSEEKEKGGRGGGRG